MPEELKDKKEYEISFILSGEEGSAEIERELSAIGAEITFKSPAASTRLAYPLKKHETGYFGYIHFMALPDRVKALKDALAHKPGVLRFLVITPAVKQVVREMGARSAAPRKEKDKAEGAPTTGSAGRLAPPAEKLMTNEALEKKLEEILK
jgi:ribosomal protein S6